MRTTCLQTAKLGQTERSETGLARVRSGMQSNKHHGDWVYRTARASYTRMGAQSSIKSAGVALRCETRAQAPRVPVMRSCDAVPPSAESSNTEVQR
jgi:hypothetical protein